MIRVEMCRFFCDGNCRYQSYSVLGLFLSWLKPLDGLIEYLEDQLVFGAASFDGRIAQSLHGFSGDFNL